VDVVASSALLDHEARDHVQYSSFDRLGHVE